MGLSDSVNLGKEGGERGQCDVRNLPSSVFLLLRCDYAS